MVRLVSFLVLTKINMGALSALKPEPARFIDPQRQYRAAQVQCRHR
jgi:hypothetical protein